MSSAGEAEDFDHSFAGAVMFIMGVVGAVICLAPCLLISKVTSLHSAYGMFCISNGFAGGGLLLAFAVWCAPSTIFRLNDNLTLDVLMNQAAMVCWYCSQLSKVLIALNSVAAIVMPISYRMHMTTRRAAGIVGVAWAACALMASVFFLDSCKIYFDVDYWYFYYSESTEAEATCSKTLVYLYDTVYEFGCLFTLTTCNIIAFVRMRMAALSLAKANQGRMNSQAQSKRSRNERKYFFQAFFTSSVFVVQWANFYFITPRLSEKWIVFWTSTVFWAFVHVVDAFVLLVLNRDLRELCFHPSRWGKPVKSSMATISVAPSRSSRVTLL